MRKTLTASFTAILLSFCLLCTGCFQLGEHTDGTNGRLEFSYTTGFLNFGQKLARPMAVGTRESVTTTLEPGTPPLVATSENPAVFRVVSTTRMSCCRSEGGYSCSSGSGTTQDRCGSRCTFKVEAAGPGSASLVLSTSDGKVWDSVPVFVAHPSRLVISGPKERGPGVAAWDPLSDLDLKLGRDDDFAIWLKLQTGDGREMQASNGFSISISGDGAATSGGRNAEGILSVNLLGDSSGIVLLRAKYRGTVNMTIRHGNISRSFRVRVR